MKKIVLAVIAALLAGAIGPASAHSGTARRVTAEYTTPPAVQGEGFWLSFFGEGIDGWTTLRVKAGEDHLSLRVLDDSGGPVAGAVYQNGERIADFCGSARNIRLGNKGRTVQVFLYSGQCQDGTVSTALGGTIKAVFSDRV